MLDYAYLVPLFPLLGVVINTFFTRKANEKLIGSLASAMIGLSWPVATNLSFLR